MHAQIVSISLIMLVTLDGIIAPTSITARSYDLGNGFTICSRDQQAVCDGYMEGLTPECQTINILFSDGVEAKQILTCYDSDSYINACAYISGSSVVYTSYSSKKHYCY